MITLHFYNSVSSMYETITLSSDNILIYARKDEYVNLQEYCNDFKEPMWRKILDIKYNKGVKEIHFSVHKFEV